MRTGTQLLFLPGACPATSPVPATEPWASSRSTVQPEGPDMALQGIKSNHSAGQAGQCGQGSLMGSRHLHGDRVMVREPGLRLHRRVRSWAPCWTPGMVQGSSIPRVAPSVTCILHGIVHRSESVEATSESTGPTIVSAFQMDDTR